MDAFAANLLNYPLTSRALSSGNSHSSAKAGGPQLGGVTNLPFAAGPEFDVHFLTPRFVLVKLCNFLACGHFEQFRALMFQSRRCSSTIGGNLRVADRECQKHTHSARHTFSPRVLYICVSHIGFNMSPRLKYELSF